MQNFLFWLLLVQRKNLNEKERRKQKRFKEKKGLWKNKHKDKSAFKEINTGYIHISFSGHAKTDFDDKCVG